MEAELWVAVIVGLVGVLGTALGATIPGMIDWRRAKCQGRSITRSKYLKLALPVLEWLEYRTVTEHDDGAPGNFLRSPMVGAGDAIQALRRISLLHPDKNVRNAANELYAALFSEFAIVSGETLGNPTFDELLGWSQEAESLCRLIQQAKQSV